jgi:hypothetical protein
MSKSPTAEPCELLHRNTLIVPWRKDYAPRDITPYQQITLSWTSMNIDFLRMLDFDAQEVFLLRREMSP